VWRVPEAALAGGAASRAEQAHGSFDGDGRFLGGATLLLDARSRAGALPDGVDF
jgi:hypothetical protein